MNVVYEKRRYHDRMERHSMMRIKVSNPEDYPDISINKRCSKCEHGQLTYFDSDSWKGKSYICKEAKVLVCISGFIKPEEFEL